MINTNEVALTTKALSILFVEDNEVLRETTAEIFKKFFQIVDTNINGEEAIEQYIKFYEKNSHHYDIVLSDIQMPIMDGIELTKHIYSINPLQHIIILSAYDDSDYLVSLINLGIEQFIKKPIDYQELLKAFQNISAKITHTSLTSNTNNQVIALGDNFLYDRENKSMMQFDKNIYLTKHEILFLQLLSTKVGKIYSNEAIVDHFNFINENIDAKNIRKLVSKLRKKLPENCIESVYGIGYKIMPTNII
ncbi:MAG: response regulator transcription factor [Campylobacterales bacterium]|nr:response regulator transcription factor [Campylobacterales bacterium]